MSTSYKTLIIGEGNHASIEIPDEILLALGANKRAPLKITINGHSYQSTATGVDGQCRVVFPQRDRAAAGVAAGDEVLVLLELEAGHRQVELPPQLQSALLAANSLDAFETLPFAKRRLLARSVGDAKTEATMDRRIAAILELLTHQSG